MSRRMLIIDAHPERFSHSLAATYRDAAIAASSGMRIITPAAVKFDWSQRTRVLAHAAT